MLGNFIKYTEKYQIWLKSGKHIRHFIHKPKYVLLLLDILNRHKRARSGC